MYVCTAYTRASAWSLLSHYLQAILVKMQALAAAIMIAQCAFSATIGCSLQHGTHIAIAGSKLGAVWGVVAAIVGPSIAIGTWFILTWRYRTEKKIILEEVIKRLKVSDIGRVDSADPCGVVIGSTARLGGGNDPSPQTRTVARHITRRCLRRWDGWMGIRASSDSLGNKAGIWRDRYDTVRCAVLLLAFRKLNQALQADPSSFRAGCPGGLTGCMYCPLASVKPHLALGFD